ncbi:MAG: tetratricopeptide repeat protein [Bacteroidales bacterium]|nr:tetratricopeptide repeat protein [Bacteroidales bacterium]MBP5679834.1 tetratricopeptide repeat protein [Bacteroidales bacterium]
MFSQDYDEWINRSFDYIDKDSLPQAEECLKKAMRLEPANPRNGMLFVNLGTLQRQQGEYKEAETSYSCAIALLSDVPKIRVNRAELYAEMSRFNEAIDDYTLLLETEPHNEDWLYRRALCKLMAADTIGAQEDLQFIDSFNPKSAKSRLGMAVIYKAQGQYSMAEELYNALLKANPESWSLLRDRAEVYFLSNRSGAALMDINKAIEKNPQDPMSYLLRAQIRFQKGDIEYGKRDLKTAVEKGLSPEIVSPLMQKYP